jgi:hypothetical protein
MLKKAVDMNAQRKILCSDMVERIAPEASQLN